MRAVPEVGGVSVVIMRISVVLPAPFGPEQAENFAVGDVEADVVDGDEVAKLFHEMVHFNRVHGSSSLACSRAARTSSSFRRLAAAARSPSCR